MITSLKIYDTLSREERSVAASDGQAVRIYCCGPTVYRDAHIGNLRTFLLADVVRRTLEYGGVKVHLVQNITDVGHMSEDFDEDKVLAESRVQKRDPFDIARHFEAKFHHDLARLNIIPADLYPRASECIAMMQEHITALFEKDLAYLGEDGNVYYASERFPSYGAISGNRLTELKPGHRYEFTESGAKRFHADWALWKAAGERKEMIWDSPWGPGFPGWHIECSAMSLKYLSGHIDLHIGGIDLRFPHHENERAQSNPLVTERGDDEAVDLWLHGEHLLFEGRKMSKSAGNVLLLQDVVGRGFDPLAVRFSLLENRYRSQMDLSWYAIAAADKVLQRWRKLTRSAVTDTLSERLEVKRMELHDALCSDLDSPRALQLLRGVEKDPAITSEEKGSLLLAIEPLLGLGLTQAPRERSLSADDASLLKDRSDARMRRDFTESDRLRTLLAERGIEVRDKPDGQEWEWR